MSSLGMRDSRPLTFNQAASMTTRFEVVEQRSEAHERALTAITELIGRHMNLIQEYRRELMEVRALATARAAEVTSPQAQPTAANEGDDLAREIEEALAESRSDLPPIPDNLQELAWPEIQRLGRAYDVEPGTKKEIIAGLEAARGVSR